jgi:hypothetical protein
MKEPADLEAEFWRVFGHVLGRPIERGRYQPAQLPEWDSLRHVELIFELEVKFQVEISPQAIADLFSDTDTILAFLRARIPENR